MFKGMIKDKSQLLTLHRLSTIHTQYRRRRRDISFENNSDSN